MSVNNPFIGITFVHDYLCLSNTVLKMSIFDVTDEEVYFCMVVLLFCVVRKR